MVTDGGKGVGDFGNYGEGIFDIDIEFISYYYTPLHAVVICGYDDADSCWTCKNSWSTSWGEDGYFRIKYGCCGIDSIGCITATVTSDACYAKICPALISSVSTALSYTFATAEQGQTPPTEQIYICGDAAINSGQSVTIPTSRKFIVGSEIGGNNGYFSGKSEIIINSGGRFIIDNDVIEHRQGSGYGLWGGICVNSGGKLELKGTNQIRNAKAGLYIKSDSVYCDTNYYTEIYEWDTWGVAVSNSSPYLHHISISGANSFSGPLGILVAGASSNPTFRNVGVYGACEIGMWVDAFSHATLEKSYIGTDVYSHKINIVDYGTLYMDHADSAYANNIYDEAGNYAIYISSSVTPFNVRRNYWGTATPIKDNLFYLSAKINEWTPYRGSYNSQAGKIVANFLAKDDEAIKNLSYAFESERTGDVKTAAEYYKDIVQGDYPERYRMKAILSLYRIVRNHTKDYSGLSDMIRTLIPGISESEAFVLNFVLSDMFIYEGRYSDAISGFKHFASQYSDPLFRAQMYSRIAGIYGSFLRDVKQAREYAEKAAVLSPGAVFVADAFACAGIEYATSKPANEESFKPPVFEPIGEKAVSEETEYIRVSPNPANPITTIAWAIKSPSSVKLTIYTVNGQKVATLVDGLMSAGAHTSAFNGAKYASGVYLYRFESGSLKKTGKILLMK